MVELEAHGPDTFVAQGPSYPWGGLYGGQIVAQALRAAAATVERRLGQRYVTGVRLLRSTERLKMSLRP